MLRPYFAMGSKSHTKRKRKRTKLYRLKKAILTTLITIILGAYLIIFIADRTIVPVVTTIANQRAVTIINEAIDTSLAALVNELNLTSEDFYNLTKDDKGRLNSLSVNTILVNQVASILAKDISHDLNHRDIMSVSVPMGLFTGIPIFAGIGPDFFVNLIPAGEATVEYETSFTSAGINQINFQVWLTINTSMSIVIPLQETTIPVLRRVVLVNTVFAGEVPEGMLLTNFGIEG